MNAIAIQSRLSRWSAAWGRFWFTPGDPTALGAIRLVTGLVTFYTMFAYSFELQELVGRDAWLDLPLRQEQYREMPLWRPSLNWTDSQYRPPVNDEERKYFLDYLAKWGEPPPMPYPRTQEEAQAYDQFRFRWGGDKRLMMGAGRPVWSIWFHVTDPAWMNVVHGGIVLCSFLFFIGFGTRITSVLTWFGALSYIHRSPPSLFGVDTMMTVLLFYLMIGPSGAALSVDRLLQRWWAKRRGLPVPPLEPSVSANLVLRLVQIHCCIIYLSAGLSKLQGTAWWTGTAPWGTIANPEYSPMQYGWYVEFLRMLAKTRWVFETLMTFAAVGTLVFEIGYTFVIWRPGLRTLWLWLAALLHLGIGMFMGLRTFSILMMAFNMAFLSPATIWWAVRKLTPQKWKEAEAEPPPMTPALATGTATAILPKTAVPSSHKPVVAAHSKRKR